MGVELPLNPQCCHIICKIIYSRERRYYTRDLPSHPRVPTKHPLVLVVIVRACSVSFERICGVRSHVPRHFLDSQSQAVDHRKQESISINTGSISIRVPSSRFCSQTHSCPQQLITCQPQSSTMFNVRIIPPPPLLT